MKKKLQMLKIMKKTDENFVKNNIKDLIEKSFKNSESHLDTAKILRSKKHFSSSLFHSITALEELAKWHFLNQNNVDYTNLEKITNHNFKMDEMLKIFQEIMNNNQFIKDDLIWLKNDRIKEMREEVLYVGLKSGNNILNWQSRAKAMINLLKIIFDYYDKNK